MFAISNNTRRVLLDILPVLAKDIPQNNRKRNAQRLALNIRKLLKKARTIESQPRAILLGLPRSVREELVSTCELHVTEYETTGDAGAASIHFECEIERGSLIYFVDTTLTFEYERDDSDIYGNYRYTRITDIETSTEVLDRETDSLYPTFKEIIKP